MAIPDYQKCMLPFLEFLSDEKDHPFREAEDKLADDFKLSSAERSELLPSGNERIFKNRIRWAIFFLKKAELLETTSRGVYKITELGLQLLETKPSSINPRFLEQWLEHKFKNNDGLNNGSASPPEFPIYQTTPEETIEITHKNLREQLSQDILDLICSCSPIFFEKLVVDVLVAMGYGGSRPDAGKRIGGTGDGGIDGIIKEDPLGLDIIYIQAKRWQGNVSRPEIQKFAG